MSMEERILAKATELIDQRVAEIMDATSAPRVVRLDDYLTIESEQGEGHVDSFPWPYAGQLQLSDTQVFVVPFVVSGLGFATLSPLPPDPNIPPTVPPVAPTINGRSIFSTNRPSLPRRSAGAAVYLQKSVTLSVNTQFRGINSVTNSCEIIQQSLTQSFPRKVGRVTWPYYAQYLDPDAVTVDESECWITTLLGVYTADGQVYPGYIFPAQRVVSYTDPLADGGYHYLGIPAYGPFTRNTTITPYPPEP